MASVMAIESEVIGECVEEIRIEVGRRDVEDGFAVSCGLCDEVKNAVSDLPLG